MGRHHPIFSDLAIDLLIYLNNGLSGKLRWKSCSSAIGICLDNMHCAVISWRAPFQRYFTYTKLFTYTKATQLYLFICLVFDAVLKIFNYKIFKISPVLWWEPTGRRLEETHDEASICWPWPHGDLTVRDSGTLTGRGTGTLCSLTGSLRMSVGFQRHCPLSSHHHADHRHRREIFLNTA